jgi:DNA-binding beta-propeller fold protein YncE
MMTQRVLRWGPCPLLAHALVACLAACGDDTGPAPSADGGDAATSAPDATAAPDADATLMSVIDATTGSDAVADEETSAPDATIAPADTAGDGASTARDATMDAVSDASLALGDATDATGPLDAANSGHVYVAAEGTGKLFVFSADGTGSVGSEAPGSPFPTGSLSAYSVTGNPAGTRVYASVASVTAAGSVTVFTLDANGNVNGIQVGSPFATGVTATPTRAVLNPAATRLYVVHQGASTGSIAVFVVDADGNLGALRPGSPYGTGSGSYAASVNPAGTRLYVTSQETHGVFVFALDANGDIGAQRPGSPVLTGVADAPLLSAVHPSGKELYVTDQSNNLIAFALDANGDITGQQTGSPFASTNSCGLALNAAGTRLYVGTNGPLLNVFALDATTGNVRGAAVPFTVGIDTFDLTEDLQQNHIYVVDLNSSRLASVLLSASGDPQSARRGSTPDGGLFPFAIYAR